MSKKIIENFPTTVLSHSDAPSSKVGFNIDAQETGSFSGLDYTIPAHAEGTIKANINALCLTSENVENLNKMVMTCLSASERESVEVTF